MIDEQTLPNHRVISLHAPRVRTGAHYGRTHLSCAHYCENFEATWLNRKDLEEIIGKVEDYFLFNLAHSFIHATESLRDLPGSIAVQVSDSSDLRLDGEDGLFLATTRDETVNLTPHAAKLSHLAPEVLQGILFWEGLRLAKYSTRNMIRIWRARFARNMDMTRALIYWQQRGLLRDPTLLGESDSSTTTVAGLANGILGPRLRPREEVALQNALENGAFSGWGIVNFLRLLETIIEGVQEYHAIGYVLRQHRLFSEDFAFFPSERTVELRRDHAFSQTTEASTFGDYVALRYTLLEALATFTSRHPWLRCLFSVEEASLQIQEAKYFEEGRLGEMLALLVNWLREARRRITCDPSLQQRLEDRWRFSPGSFSRPTEHSGGNVPARVLIQFRSGEWLTEYVYPRVFSDAAVARVQEDTEMVLRHLRPMVLSSSRVQDFDLTLLITSRVASLIRKATREYSDYAVSLGTICVTPSLLRVEEDVIAVLGQYAESQGFFLYPLADPPS